MDRPVAFDRRHDVLLRLGVGHDCSTENAESMIVIIFHISSIATRNLQQNWPKLDLMLDSRP
jgi:hypothetical protein